MRKPEPIDQIEWQRLEAEYPDATPERREHIDELLDEMEFEAGERWMSNRQNSNGSQRK